MVRSFLSLALLLSIFARADEAQAQMVAFIAPGASPTRAASRAVLRSFAILEEQEEVEVVDSREIRRALAGLPPHGEPGAEGEDPDISEEAVEDLIEDDPLEDVRRLVRRATGDRLSQSLSRLGDRLGVDLFITVRQVGQELELRGFNTERTSFYRGTMMIPALEAPESDQVTEFVMPRVSAMSTNVRSGGETGEDGEETEGGRGSRRSRWWIWLVIGGVAAAAAVIVVLVQPDEVQHTGVTLRIRAP